MDVLGMQKYGDHFSGDYTEWHQKKKKGGGDYWKTQQKLKKSKKKNLLTEIEPLKLVF